MKVEQRIWEADGTWRVLREDGIRDTAQLVLVFGDYDTIHNAKAYSRVKDLYPNAQVLGSSACGAIHGAEITDSNFVVTALFFERTDIKIASIVLNNETDSFSAGEALATQLQEKEMLRHIFILCDGLHTDGDALTRGLASRLSPEVTVTGGLAGDLEKFKATSVIANAESATETIAAVGLYGKDICIGHGCVGGWDTFGQERKVTRSDGNILYEIDHQPALSLYKKYLGDMADGLPATALYFPLNLRFENCSTHIVRSVLSINEEDDSLVFGGEIPCGATVTLMKASVNRLVEGAADAGEMSIQTLEPHTPDLAIIVSCAARKMVMKQRTEEETEAVQNSLNNIPCMTGFYSFGEICPTSAESTACKLHNQTMTITTLHEKRS